jgi:hypothetical protein
VAKAAQDAQLPVNVEEYVASFRHELMEPVAAWVRGARFVDVLGMTDLYEGSLVRAVRRLEELMRQVRGRERCAGGGQGKEVGWEGPGGRALWGASVLQGLRWGLRPRTLPSALTWHLMEGPSIECSPVAADVRYIYCASCSFLWWLWWLTCLRPHPPNTPPPLLPPPCVCAVGGRAAWHR